MTRSIVPVVRKVALSELDKQAERRAYWRQQPAEAHLAEVESLRRMWIELHGDPDEPISRVVNKRRLGEPAPVKTR